MAVLVTGGSGFLGVNLTLKLQARGEQVVSLSSQDADLRDPGSLTKFSNQAYERSITWRPGLRAVISP